MLKLIMSNYTVFFVQIGINLNRYMYMYMYIDFIKKAEIASAEAAPAISAV